MDYLVRAVEITADIVVISVTVGGALALAFSRVRRAWQDHVQPIFVRFGVPIALILMLASVGVLFSFLKQLNADLASAEEGIARLSDELDVADKEALEHIKAESFSVDQTAEFAWRQGQGATRMIPVSEGVCFLTFVTGRFEGGGEQVRVSRNSEGYWVLGGASQQAGVAAGAACWRFPTVPAEAG